MRLQGNLVPSPNLTVPAPTRPSYQPSLIMTCSNAPAAAPGCSDRSTQRCTVVHFHSRCCKLSDSNEATALEITAGAGICEHVESGHAAGSPGGSAAGSSGGSGGNRCMKARNLGRRMASGFVSGLVVDPRENIAAPAAASIAPAVRAPADGRNSCTASWTARFPGVLAATKTVRSSGHQLMLPAQCVQIVCPQGRTAVFSRKQ